MAEIEHETHRARGNAKLDLRGSAIGRQASRPHLLALAALACLLAVAAAYLTTYGWSGAVRELSHAYGHLPRPLQIIVGGSRFAHLLAAAQ